MLCNLRNLSLASLSLAIGLQLAAPAMAIPPDIASRAGRYARRAAEERNALRQREEAEAAEAAEEIPADAEVVDDEVETDREQAPIGTGTRHPVRRAAFDESIDPAPPRRSSRPMPSSAQRAQRAGHVSNQFASGNVRNSFAPSRQPLPSRAYRGPDQYINAQVEEMEEGEVLPMPSKKRVTTRSSQPMDGQPIYEEEYYDEGEGYYGPGHMGRNWGDNCDPCCFQLPRLCYFEAFAGAHGFTGPLNRGTGSFGFQEGFNAGLPFLCGTTFQGGINATQSNFEGSPFTADDRTQFFTTLGFFRRVDCGLQAGLVVDYLNDNWDYGVDLAQLRGEVGWKLDCGNELGFWFAAGLDQTTTDAQVPFFGNNSVAFRTSTLEVEPVDIYAFYYRRQFACGGEGRAFGGFTDDSRGLLGGNIRLPINPCWQFSTDFMYVVANSDSDFRFNDESWNVSFNLVWTPCRGSGGCQNYCRPLLDVANNGSFLTRLAQ
ncbi:MAG: DUF6666 family protein [Pirellulaceae bacterium]